MGSLISLDMFFEFAAFVLFLCTKLNISVTLDQKNCLNKIWFVPQIINQLLNTIIKTQVIHLRVCLVQRYCIVLYNIADEGEKII